MFMQTQNVIRQRYRTERIAEAHESNRQRHRFEFADKDERQQEIVPTGREDDNAERGNRTLQQRGFGQGVDLGHQIPAPQGVLS